MANLFSINNGKITYNKVSTNEIKTTSSKKKLKDLQKNYESSKKVVNNATKNIGTYLNKNGQNVNVNNPFAANVISNDKIDTTKRNLNGRTTLQDVVQDHKNLLNTETGQKLKNELRTAKNERAWSEYNYNVEKVNNEETSLYDKTLGNVTRGIVDLTSNFGDSRNVVDENGKTVKKLSSYNELKQSKVSDDYNTGIGKFLGDATYNISKIGAAAALNTVTLGVGGSALYWSDMFFDGYNNAKNGGYEDKNALAYAIGNTSFEYVVGKLLGSATKSLTGGTSSELSNAIANGVNKFISNPKVASIIGNAGSEATEEFIQEYLDNINKLVTLDGSKDPKDYINTLLDLDVLKDAFYSAGVGALSGGVIQGFNNQEGKFVDTNVNLFNNFKKELETKKANETDSSKVEQYNSLIQDIDDYISEPFGNEETANNTISTVQDLITSNSFTSSLENQISNVQSEIDTYESMESLTPTEQEKLQELEQQLISLQQQLNDSNNTNIPTVADIVSQEQNTASSSNASSNNSTNILPVANNAQTSQNQVNLPTIENNTSVSTSNNPDLSDTSSSIPKIKNPVLSSIKKFQLNNPTITSYDNNQIKTMLKAADIDIPTVFDYVTKVNSDLTYETSKKLTDSQTNQIVTALSQLKTYDVTGINNINSSLNTNGIRQIQGNIPINQKLIRKNNGYSVALINEIENKTIENVKGISDVDFISPFELMKYKTSGGYRTEEEILKLKNSIINNGIVIPIRVVKNSDGTLKIEDGNHKIDIACELGLSKIPVEYVESIDNWLDKLYNNANEEEIVNGRRNQKDSERRGTNGRNNISNYKGVENARTTATDDKSFSEIQGFNNRPSGNSRGGLDIDGNSKGLNNNSSFFNSQNQDSSIKLPTVNNNTTQTTENNTNNVAPVRYVYKETDNQKINNLRQSASKYFDNSKNTQSLIKVAEKVITDKNLNIVFDDTISNNDNFVNAKISTEGNETTIKLNPNSERAGEFLIMHELTHSIETDTMKQLVMDYASKNNEFNNALESLKKAYGTENVTDEVLADISGQLFGNQEFINNLSTKQPSVFRRIYNAIISLANKITGNSKYSLFVKDLQSKWEEAYRSQNSNLNGTKYSIQQDVNGNKYVNVDTDQDIFDGVSIKDYNKIAKMYINDYLLGKTSLSNNDTAIIDTKSAKKYTNPGKRQSNFQEKMKLTPELKNVLEISNKVNTSPPTKDTSKYSNWEYYDFNFKLGNQTFNGIVNIGIDSQGNKHFYEVNNIKKTSGISETSPNRPTGFSDKNIPQSNTNVKLGISTKYSMQESNNNTQELDNSSFSLDKNAKRYEDLQNSVNLEYFKKDNGDVRVNLLDENSKLVNQLDLYSEGYAEQQLGKQLGDKVYNYAKDNNQTIYLGNNKVTSETDYFMTHRPSESGVYASDITKTTNTEDYENGEYMPSDVYEHPEWYFNMNEDYSKESYSVLKKIKGKPNADITIYRATTGNKINNGDWVTLSKKYAEHHNNSQFNGKGNILELKVKAKDIQWAGDDINEFGYFPTEKYSQNNSTWQEHLEKNYKATGTRTDMQDVKLPSNKKILNPNEISKLTKENANTTPKLPSIKVETGKGESHFYENVTKKTKMLPDNVRSLLATENDIQYYKEVTNNESLEKALNRLNEKGRAETMRWFNQDGKDANSTDVAEGWILLKQYSDAKDYDSVVQVAKRLRDIGTKAGQTVQAFNILNRLTPEGMVKYAQSELSEAYDNMVKNKTKAWIDEHKADFDLKPNEVAFIMDTMKEVSNMEDGYDKKVKLAEIQKLMTDKLPPQRGAGIKAWMRISMLFNPKTQVRNVMGNAVIAPVNYFSDLVSGAVDSAIYKKTGVRTTGTTNLKNYGKGFKTGLFQSYNDFKKGINTRNIEGNRFEITEGKSFNDKTKIGKALNKVDNLLSFMLDAGDRGFYEASFTNSINNQLVLNNTTEVTQDMIDIATNEALQRTWQDNNDYTRFVLKARAGINKFGQKFLIGNDSYGLGDVLIPFAKTPANLTKAIVDYSPVGLIDTINQGITLNRSLTNGQYTPQMQHQFVQSLGKATAGTMLYVLGIALANAGITSGESDDDKDVANFMKNTLGISSYSIKIGNKSFTYDWAQPVAAPLSITANIVSSKNNKGQALFEGILANLDTAGNILLEQSFLDSLNDVLSNNDGAISGIINEIMELPSRAIPTLSKQIVDLTDSTQRQTYEYNQPIQTAINSIKAKIPVLSQTLAPSVDTMGREIQRYGGKNNIFNVFLNPANVNTENISESAEEIYRLYKETGDSTIMPRVSPYYINQDGEKITLTSKQRAKFQEVAGDIVESSISNLLEDSTYNSYSDTDKAEIINKIVNYSYNKAKEEVLGIEMSNEYNKINLYVDDGGEAQDYYLNKEEIDYSYTNPAKYKTITQITSYGNYQTYADEIADIKEKYTSSSDRKSAVIQYVNSLNLSIPQKAMLIRMNYSSFKSYDNQIIEYINSQDMTIQEKAEILEELGFKIRNGKVYSK